MLEGMRLSDQAVREFKEICRGEFGVEFSYPFGEPRRKFGAIRACGLRTGIR
jgi:hypothetical protein